MAKFFPAFYLTETIVGAGQRNDPADVKLIQTLFLGIQRFASMQNLGPLTADGRFGPALEGYIRSFQQNGFGPGRLVVDGMIHPMRLQRGDLRSTFRSGVGSTLYALNIASMANVPQLHAQIGPNLALRAVTEV